MSYLRVFAPSDSRARSAFTYGLMPVVLSAFFDRGVWDYLPEFRFDDLLKSRGSRHSCESRSPEWLDKTKFPPTQSLPHYVRNPIFSRNREIASPNYPYFPAKIADFGLNYCILRENAKKAITGSTSRNVLSTRKASAPGTKLAYYDLRSICPKVHNQSQFSGIWEAFFELLSWFSLKWSEAVFS